MSIVRNNNIMIMSLAILITFTMILPIASPLIGRTSVAASKEIVLIRIDDENQISDLIDIDVEVIESYEGFVLGEIAVSNKMFLEERGFILEPMDYRTIISFNGMRFDTRNGEPILSSSLRLDSYPIHRGYYLVQFIGPIKEEWKKDIVDLGGRFHDYIPWFAFIVEMNERTKEKVEQLIFVQWIGIYQPAYKINPSLKDISGEVKINIFTFKGWDLDTIAKKVEEFDGKVLSTYDTRLRGVIRAEIDSSAITAIANFPWVKSIGSYFQPRIINDDATWICQTNIDDNRSIFNKGINGNNQIITVQDSEFDEGHEMFDDSVPIGSSHRKVLDLYALGGGTLSGGNVHGTHVSGIAAGDAPLTPGGTDWYSYNKYDGNSFFSKLIFQDIDDYADMWGSVYPPDDLRDGFQPAYDAGSRIHTNSWGGHRGYKDDAVEIDDFTFNHPNFVTVFAMGNDGSAANTLSEQAEAKNAISVGGTKNYANQNDMYTKSSRGYADDGRIKPTVLGVANPVTSAKRGSGNNYEDKSGTSMSTPQIAAQCALVRQYFLDGFYPSGISNPADEFTPTAALVKAMIVNGAEEISGSGTYANGNKYPNGDQGWGRSHLENCLYFTGDERYLDIRDNTTVKDGEEIAQFTASGQYREYIFRVDSVDISLEFTLVWSDYPGVDDANPAIVNNLDLTVTDPDGKSYKGNVFTGYNPGYSKIGGTTDNKNIVESVLLIPGYNTFNTGNYTVRVDATNIADLGTLGYQGFALVVTSGTDRHVDSPTNLRAELSGAELGDVSLQWNKSADDGKDMSNYAIYYNSSYNSNGIGYSFLVDVDAGIDYYVHSGAGDGDSNNYFYYVQANDTSGNTNWADQAGKFVKEMQTGTQLIAIPLEQSNTALTTVLQTIEGSYSYVEWYDANANHWKTYSTNKPSGYNDLLNVDHKIALWITMTYLDNLTITGKVPSSTSIQLYEGWNFVSYASFINRTIEDALGSILYEKVEGFEESAPPYYLNMLGNTDWMEAGNGYWIYVTSDCTWVVEN